MVLGWFLRASGGNAGTTEHLNGGQRQAEIRMHIVNMDGGGGGGGCARMNNGKREGWCSSSGFQMPLHYPRYKKEDYEKMEEWKVDMVLREYGLSFDGSLQEKRAFAMGTFLWPEQL